MNGIYSNSFFFYIWYKFNMKVVKQRLKFWVILGSGEYVTYYVFSDKFFDK